MNKILAIETSCDETAAAVYHDEIRSNVIYSQTEEHKKFGGVIPEIASRSHIEKITPIVQQALDKAAIPLSKIDIIAVTTKPGLPGSLLVGLCFAKAVALASNKKIIGVDHLEGHVFSSFLEYQVPFPHICLTASGGHTALYAIKGFGEYEVLGQTLDDAAGEAFDKVAKLLGLPYPGGPIIEKLAAEVNFEDFFHYPRPKENSLDFSFSGLKTAVMYDLIKRNLYNLETKQATQYLTDIERKKIASSFLVCVKDIFLNKLNIALKKYPYIKAFTFVGGVACNKYLKKELTQFCQYQDVKFFSPSSQYCTDNAAMIAFVAHYKALQNKFSDLMLDIFS